MHVNVLLIYLFPVYALHFYGNVVSGFKLFTDLFAFLLLKGGLRAVSYTN